MNFSNPQEREQFYGQMVDRYVERMDRHYQLTDEQKTQFRAQLEEAKKQQVTYSEQHAQEFRSMRDDFQRLRDSSRDGRMDPSRFREMETRYRRLREESPLMNSDKITEQLEKMLPPEQAQQGRVRHEAEHAERRRVWEQERQRREEQWSQPQQSVEQGDPQQSAEGNGTGEPTSRNRLSDRRRSSNGEREDSSRQRGDGGYSSRRSFRGGDSRSDREETNVAGAAVQLEEGRGTRHEALRENPISSWEQYLRDFIKRYNLDAAQQATAWSILREMQERRTAHELAHRVDYEQARQMKDASQREQRMNELNLPIVRSFEELKRRLMRIPSSSQRQAAGVDGLIAPPASEPSLADNRPTTSKPS